MNSPVALHVKLEPHRAAGRLGDVLHAHRSAAADHVRGLGVGRTAHRRQFALRMDELLCAGRRQQDRKRQLLAEQLDPRIQLRDVHQRPRVQADFLVGLVIPPQRQLVRRAARNARPCAVGDHLLRLGLEIEERQQRVQRRPRGRLRVHPMDGGYPQGGMEHVAARRHNRVDYISAGLPAAPDSLSA